MFERIRSRRRMNAHNRAIAKALQAAPSEALRHELLEIANRYE